ncbi:ABC transporter permease [Paenibacillus kobensis]|uniref:ABC transporter permease n=1 Tax=Paenibacillus kobensis TaxID=59841 RepID=UPI000FD95B2D|nr:FtsX-like permease family protein [Paenibacillus kobensis]
MLARRIVWKMALANISRSWKQTLLTVLAGSIGAMLVVISYVNYTSTTYSGKAWIDRHYGAIKWELTPADGKALFSVGDTEAISNTYRTFPGEYKVLPVVHSQTTLLPLDGQGHPSKALPGTLTLGFDFNAAAQLDPRHSELWSAKLDDDSAVIDAYAADLLGLSAGEAITLESASGEALTFQVRQIVPPEGLTGYLGANAESAATVIVSEASARKLAQLKEGYDWIFAGNAFSANLSFAIPDELHDLFKVRMVKWQAESRADQMSKQLFIVSMISAVAVVSSALLMRQVLIMIADSRRELFGVLRAIGFSKRQIRGLFGAEALLLAGISSLVGTIAGAGAGILLVKLFYGAYTQELGRMTGANIPVVPHVSIPSLVVLWAMMGMFLSLIAVFVARAAGRTRILDALRRAVSTNRPEGKKKRLLTMAVLTLSAAAVVVHLSQLIGKPAEATGSSLLVILLLWLAACIGSVLIISRLAASAIGPIAAIARTFRFSNVSILLAGKFSRQHPSRTVTIMLLFALLMMTLTFTASLSSMFQTKDDVDRTNQTMLGFGGYAAYDTVQQKDQIMQVVKSNETIRELVSQTTYVEPYMLLTKNNGIANSIVPVTDELLAGGGLHMHQWSSQFKSEQEAWEAVRNDERYIVLPLDYLYADTRQDRASFDPQVLIKAGETLELPIYESKHRAASDEWQPVETKSFIVAGFAENNSDTQLNTAIFRPLYVNPAVHERSRPHGSKWSDHEELGYVLLQYDYADIKQTQRIEEQLLLSGVTTFQSPYEDNRAIQLVNLQMSRGFIGFTALSALIGLFGLAIIQFRAVGERASTIAMMRCVGLSGRHISGMFILEGSIIGIAGLLVGCLIGSTGATVFIRTLSQDVLPGENPLTFEYPFMLIGSLLLVLLSAAVAVNLGPARGALKLAPAEVLRTAD